MIAGSSSVDMKKTIFLSSDSGREKRTWPRAVIISTFVYWKESGMTPIMNTRMPQTLFAAICPSEVNRETNGAAIAKDSANMTPVKARHMQRMIFSAFLMSPVFFAP